MNKEPQFILVKKFPDWEEYFDYYEAKVSDGIFFKRVPKKGFEYLEYEHGTLEEIKEIVKRTKL